VLIACCLSSIEWTGKPGLSRIEQTDHREGYLAAISKIRTWVVPSGDADDKSRPDLAKKSRIRAPGIVLEPLPVRKNKEFAAEQEHRDEEKILGLLSPGYRPVYTSRSHQHLVQGPSAFFERLRAGVFLKPREVAAQLLEWFGLCQGRRKLARPLVHDGWSDDVDRGRINYWFDDLYFLQKSSGVAAVQYDDLGIELPEAPLYPIVPTSIPQEILPPERENSGAGIIVLQPVAPVCLTMKRLSLG
jgi:hypothetical protein